MAAAMALTACAEPTPEPTPLPLIIAATELAAPLALDLGTAYRDIAPDVLPVLTVVPQSALASELAAGRADLALTASPPAGQFATPLGYVALTVVVHPTNPLNTLSLAQAQAVFTGRASDWSQLGGEPGAVQVVVREAGSDGAGAFQSAALGQAAVTPTALVAPTWAAMRALVGESASALGYLPAWELDASIKAVSVETDLTALILAAAPTEPTGLARAFLAWAQSDLGQAVVAQRHRPLR